MMQDPQLQPDLSGEERSHLWISLALGVVLVVALVGLIIFLNHGKSGPGGAQQQSLPFGAVEQAYAQRVQFTNPEMSRAANFLNQEVTYVNGVVLNNGTRRILAVDISADFRDVSGSVILHENRRLITGSNSAIEAGQRHSFQLAFDSVPSSWNQTYPVLKITGLALE